MLVGKEIAEKEINSWLDFKKVDQEKRVNLEKVIERMIALVQDGTFIIKPETFVIEHALKFPIGQNPPIKTLSYKPRIPVSALQDHLSGVNQKDGIAVTLAYIAALTDTAKGILKNLDNEDYRNADMVAVFFAT
jgi:hypothetical protein